MWTHLATLSIRALQSWFSSFRVSAGADPIFLLAEGAAGAMSRRMASKTTLNSRSPRGPSGGLPRGRSRAFAAGSSGSQDPAESVEIPHRAGLGSTELTSWGGSDPVRNHLEPQRGGVLPETPVQTEERQLGADVTGDERRRQM